jgi:hypothetical protein
LSSCCCLSFNFYCFLFECLFHPHPEFVLWQPLRWKHNTAEIDEIFSVTLSLVFPKILLLIKQKTGLLLWESQYYFPSVGYYLIY